MKQKTPYDPGSYIWEKYHTSHEEVSYGVNFRTKFLQNLEGDGVTITRKYTLRSNTLEIAKAVATICSGRIRSTYEHVIWVEGIIDGHPVLAEVDVDRQSSAYDDDEEVDHGIIRQKGLVDQVLATFGVEATAHPDALLTLFSALDKIYSNQIRSRIHWWYKGSRGPQFKKIYLPPLTTKLYPEYYPDLEGGPSQFIKSYLEAPESLLLMSGPPGTGKTTLLRHMLMENNLVAHVCYDEGLMASDDLFQNFLMDKESDILIVEDADTLLTSRERDNNHLMSRFLNVSDGLIKLPNKKLVFTTNLTDFARVDTALLRPGRCFAVLHTRALDLKEAQDASKVGGFPTPTEKKQYTIAELFNQGRASNHVRRIGFTG